MPNMNDLPPDIQARRAIEDRAATLGAQRRELNQRLEANTHAMIDLVREAGGSGIPFEQLAALLGVSRQTIFNWRELAATFQPSETAAEALAKRTPEGHAVHYKG
jgi:Homeodomain-like domain